MAVCFCGLWLGLWHPHQQEHVMLGVQPLRLRGRQQHLQSPGAGDGGRLWCVGVPALPWLQRLVYVWHPDGWQPLVLGAQL